MISRRILFMLTGLSAFAAEDSVAGRWTVRLQSEGAAPLTLELKQEGTRVNGVLALPMDDIVLTGSFEGGELRLAGTLYTNDEHASAPEAVLKGALKPDGTLSGEFAMAGKTLRWSAERRK